MARGTGSFDGESLRSVRRRRGLTAAGLAELVGTTKAMILAYENGRHVPESRRAQQLTRALNLPDVSLLWHPSSFENVPTLHSLCAQLELPEDEFRELLGLNPSNRFSEPLLSRSIETISTIRQRTGMTVAEVAKKADVGLSSYRRIEQEAMLPVRGRAGIPHRLANVLGVPFFRVQRALDHHPRAVLRQYEIAKIMESLIARYCGPSKVPSVACEDEDLRKLAALLRQPLTLVARVAEHELRQHQALLRRRMEMMMAASFPLSEEVDYSRERRQRSVERAISYAPYRAGLRITRFLSDAMTSRQWRSLCSIVQRLMIHERPLATGLSDQQEPDLWPALLSRRLNGHPFVRETNPPVDGSGIGNTGKFYFLTPSAFAYYESNRLTYQYLYPRIYTVRVPTQLTRYEYRLGQTISG
ncbi:helix-turn-helix domain-containing protein (plasmid) [Streptomyces virginiae]|uniref:helix-turn-helix transcriptional regulator n=1 Tax=Streptomyces virginiae TaxID=1961 RepID=UPI002F916A01